MMVLGGIIALVALVIMWTITSGQSKKLADPVNTTVIYLAELADHVNLAEDGMFVVNMYRQSGNIYADGKVFETRGAALSSASATFRRAQIDAVEIGQNDNDRLQVTRAFYDGRGRAEGKKVGWFEIVRVTE